MNWTIASDNQLWTILKYDDDCSHSLMSGAVLELINRNAFDKLIIDAIHHVMQIKVVEQIYKWGLEDFLQLGRITVFNALDKFDRKKNKKFISFAYMLVKHEMIHQMEAFGALKRDCKNDTSIYLKDEEGREYEFFLRDQQTNVEKYVVNKVTLEQLLTRVNKHQRKVINYYLQGYTFDEISKIMERGSLSTMQASYTKAIQKMRRGVLTWKKTKDYVTSAAITVN